MFHQELFKILKNKFEPNFREYAMLQKFELPWSRASQGIFI